MVDLLVDALASARTIVMAVALEAETAGVTSSRASLRSRTWAVGMHTRRVSETGFLQLRQGGLRGVDCSGMGV